MAFSNNPLDPTGRSIITQVAFKGAIDLAVSGKIDVTDVLDFTKDFTKGLTGQVQVQKDEFFDSLPPKQEAPATAPVDNYDAQAGLEAELGATEAPQPRILGKAYNGLGIPAWAVAQMNAAGVTKVFDNRDRVEKAIAEGKQKLPPDFKTPNDADEYGEPADKGFWRPRKRN